MNANTLSLIVFERQLAVIGPKITVLDEWIVAQLALIKVCSLWFCWVLVTLVVWCMGYACFGIEHQLNLSLCCCRQILCSAGFAETSKVSAAGPQLGCSVGTPGQSGG